MSHWVKITILLASGAGGANGGGTFIDPVLPLGSTAPELRYRWGSTGDLWFS
ncbi:hypothetical protein [Scytonema sp. HK-05]|uniref:hypothetical protein n=1 Tax=Scytonema sp. HK-05 TaxID=1137095 RepID=UPI000AE7A21E|nr:hypothetical protein [Scytonema sp. HK-05]